MLHSKYGRHYMVTVKKMTIFYLPLTFVILSIILIYWEAETTT